MMLEAVTRIFYCKLGIGYNNIVIIGVFKIKNKTDSMLEQRFL